MTTTSNGSDAFAFRTHRPGDIGWIVHRHGVLYNQECGWGSDFEGLVASVLGDFARRGESARERCWIAEYDGRFAGCVFVTRQDDAVAQLRCLLVEPFARGRGLGGTLVNACISFAREAGYEKLVLWTNRNLAAAGRLYERTGFVLVREEAHGLFGKGLTGQTWSIDLARSA